MEERKLENQFIDFERVEGMIEMPTPVTLFPRYKRVPEKPNMTVWEQFARKKGI